MYRKRWPILVLYWSTRKLFASEDEGFEFYNKYAFDKGFSVRKSYMEFWNIFVILEHFGNACLRVCLDPTL